MKRNKLLLICTSICLILLLTIGISYSYWKLNSIASKENDINLVECFEVTLSEDTSSISLESAYPISSIEGKKLDRYTFTITNTGSEEKKCAYANYTINLEMLSDTTLASEYVAIWFNKGTETSADVVKLNSLTPTTTYYTGSTESKVLVSGYLASGESATYSLGLWIHEDVTIDDDAQNKTFSAKIVVESKAIEDIRLLKDAILADNTSKGELTTSLLSESPTASTSGLYEVEDDLGTSYVYRGLKSSINNHIIFANFCWQIIRVNGDGSVRLIYNGGVNDGTCNTVNNILSTSSKYNSAYNDNAYVGYMYGTAGSSTYDLTHTNTNSSTIKSVLDSWYKSNLTSYSSYIVDNGFCNDRSITTTYLGYGTNETYYNAYTRITSTTPSLKCSQDNDLFTTTTASSGNKALTYPVGLISADEAIYAGLLASASSISNINVWLVNSATGYLTMTPSSFYDGAAHVFVIFKEGYLDEFTVNFTTSSNNSVRPVINIDSDTIILYGDGTVDNPYYVG